LETCFAVQYYSSDLPDRAIVDCEWQSDCDWCRDFICSLLRVFQ